MTAYAPTSRWPLVGLFGVVLVLGGCASVGGYGYPAGTSSGGNYPAPSSRQQLEGAVRNVDHRNRRFLVDDRSGRRVDIAYDSGTRLNYRGQSFPVSGLEPGDEIRVIASASRGRGAGWIAEDIEVLRNVRAGGHGSGYGTGYGDVVQRSGAVDYVDMRARVIGYTEGGFTGSRQQVAFDGRTVVEYRGQRYPVDAIERGDLVRLELRRNGDRWVAQRILVEVSSRER